MDGVPVFEALVIAHTTRQGELVSLGSQFVVNPGLAADRGAGNRAALLARPGISAQRAVGSRLKMLGESTNLDEVTSKGSRSPVPKGAKALPPIICSAKPLQN